jgi:tRNA-binding protein
MIDISDFEKLDIRVGTVTDAKPFPEARKPAVRLWIDFGGELGVRQSSAQITVHYRPDQLIGRQVCAVVNLPPRQIGPVLSEVLTLGMPDENGEVVLIKPDFKIPDGGRLY